MTCAQRAAGVAALAIWGAAVAAGNIYEEELPVKLLPAQIQNVSLGTLWRYEDLRPGARGFVAGDVYTAHLVFQDGEQLRIGNLLDLRLYLGSLPGFDGVIDYTVTLQTTNTGPLSFTGTLLQDPSPPNDPDPIATGQFDLAGIDVTLTPVGDDLNFDLLRIALLSREAQIIPEPASLLLLTGLVLGAARRHRRARSEAFPLRGSRV